MGEKRGVGSVGRPRLKMVITGRGFYSTARRGSAYPRHARAINSPGGYIDNWQGDCNEYLSPRNKDQENKN
jgi:hypothetical protein